ncbi:MAG: hypothetical protein EOO46_00035 [Flavobacterium sp.]|nr:MAG: hypothetical protein EOO46_00035 [Flavobacterium sp.]
MAKISSCRSLLECWAPMLINQVSGADINPIPIAFISTTFTFDAEFFEEECLTRFLAMETEKENDGVAFLIERDEKLAGLHGGIVFVDQLNCRGERSLRWDLIPCRVKRGIMHSKITILHWSNCIRLIIGSANLTHQGYCINQEVFGVIDYLPGGDGDLAIFSGALDQLRSIVGEQCGEVGKKRFNKLQSELKSTLHKWKIIDKVYNKDEIAVSFLPVTPMAPNGLERLRAIFSLYSSSPPNSIYITSPFFDKEEHPYTPSIKVNGILRKKGASHIIYNVTTERESESSNSIIVNAPGFLKSNNAPGLSISFEKITETGLNEEAKSVPRPLHQKSIWLCNEDIQLYMIGSSNFTSSALGLGKYINYEANLVYVVSKGRNKKGYNLMCESYIETAQLDKSLLIFRSRPNEDEETEANEFRLLPGCFGEAVINKSGEAYLLELNFNNDNVPKGFKIQDAVQDSKGNIHYFFNEEQWIYSGKKLKIILDWKENIIPDFLLVSWNDSNGDAFWPVIVENRVTLPPVDCLRDLPLEALLQVLGSNQPLHRLLKRIERIKLRSKGSIDEVVDPHKLVNTAGFLLQRTRRVTYGMKSLRERLEKPVFTKESLMWRLYGPIGVNALVEAIKRESSSNSEKQFLLAELALELSRIQPKTTEFSINSRDVKLAVKKVVAILENSICINEFHDENSIHLYSLKAFQKAIDAL